MTKITPQLLHDIQVLAAKAAVDPDFMDWYRRICRWYSKEFSTPLQEVMKMSEEEIIMIYFEDFYYQLSQRTDDNGKAAYEAAIDALIRPEDEVIEEEREDDEWYREELERLQNENSGKPDTNQEDGSSNIHDEAIEAAKSMNPNLMEDLPDKIFVDGESSFNEDE